LSTLFDTNFWEIGKLARLLNWARLGYGVLGAGLTLKILVVSYENGNIQ
jgi:hypothetical protein